MNTVINVFRYELLNKLVAIRLYNGWTVFNLSFQIHKFSGCQYVEYYRYLHACNVLKIDIVFFQMISFPPGRF